jgi:hypothetical protein
MYGELEYPKFHSQDIEVLILQEPLRQREAFVPTLGRMALEGVLVTS